MMTLVVEKTVGRRRRLKPTESQIITEQKSH